jgi:hypothetical protein
MADLQSVLSRLDSDPDDPHVLAGLAEVTAAAASGLDANTTAALAHTRKRFRDRGRPTSRWRWSTPSWAAAAARAASSC